MSETNPRVGETVFLNGALLPADQAAISVYDGGFLHGAGLFETMRADYGRVFRLNDHIDRLIESAAKLGLPIERTDLPLTRDFEQLLVRNHLESARVRMTVTVGSVHPVYARSGSPPLNVCVTAAGLTPVPQAVLTRGLDVVICPFRQSKHDPLAGHKTINYLPRLMAMRSAQKLNCGEALWFTPENLLAEGCISNVFVVRGGALYTPPLDTPVLPGVSRAVILEIAAERSIAAEEKPLNINDVLDADEVILCNSSLQVIPVCRIEKKEIGDGTPGAVARRLREWFIDKVKGELNTEAGSDG